MKEDIVNNQYQITKVARQEKNEHRSFVLWLTGLSGSGKSTLANAIEVELFKQGIRTYVLDGDNLRLGLNKDLGFSSEDRIENIRRVAEVSKIMIDAGMVVIGAFISPTAKSRNQIENIVGKHNFIEVYVSTSIEVCENRDVKGLYKKARSGEINNMTGVSAPYEKPLAPAIVIDTEIESIADSAKRILDFIVPKLAISHE